MKIKVQLYVAGQVFDEVVRAVDYEEARKVALARNPNATVVSVTAVFQFYWFSKHDRITAPTVRSFCEVVYK